jgi:hypothetical protein
MERPRYVLGYVHLLGLFGMRVTTLKLGMWVHVLLVPNQFHVIVQLSALLIRIVYIHINPNKKFIIASQPHVRKLNVLLQIVIKLLNVMLNLLLTLSLIKNNSLVMHVPVLIQVVIVLVVFQVPPQSTLVPQFQTLVLVPARSQLQLRTQLVYTPQLIFKIGQ